MEASRTADENNLALFRAFDDFFFFSMTRQKDDVDRLARMHFVFGN